jgi:hypothetical protein
MAAWATLILGLCIVIGIGLATLAISCCIIAGRSDRWLDEARKERER